MNIPILRYYSKKKRTGRGSTGSFLALVPMKKRKKLIGFFDVQTIILERSKYIISNILIFVNSKAGALINAG